MPAPNILRINQEKLELNRYRVELSYQASRANAEFEFSLSEQEQEDLRWYLEEYLMYPDGANTKRAKSIETFMQATGETLTEKVLESDRTTRRLWNTCLDNLNDMRIEVETSVEAATSIPWELLYVPEIKNYLCLEAQSFVRSYREGARITDPDDSEVVRVLLVICRPNAGNDVPFRSVASRIIKSLGTSINERVELDVLRPATYESLGAKLRAAQLAGTPYHIVHFDGHGTYKNVVETTDASQLSEIRYGDKGGYLIFEDPEDDNNREYVDGIKLGELLAQTGVPMLVLNACQSAYAEARNEDDPDDDHTTDTSEKRKSEVEAYGSLAQQVMAAGVSGVVAMRYSVYVVTAAQFVADLYNTLAQGFTLGQAVNMGRKRLNDQPQRKVRHDPIPLRDWMVPIVFERAPLQLLPRQESTTLTIGTITKADGTSGQQSEDDQLPRTPDLGFFGRDETLLALDRTFDSKHVALLHAYAGSGKTTTAAEFARWYNLTGGIKNGVVIFTSFEQYRPLENVLSDFGRVLGPSLQAAGIPWHAIIDKAERRQVVLTLLAQLPVLWIWDNVEGVHGFPRGTDSQWSVAEQQELADFLRDAKNTQAKFLLTSRLDEREWLGDFLPKRIPMRPMPMWERVQMADEIVRHADRRFEWTVWQPLLQYTGGNPLTLQVLVTQAVRDKIRTREAMREFVGKLRRGEVNFQDDATQGRSKSLGASLAYGYDAAFSDEERAQLAVLHLFQGFVDADALMVMGLDANDNTLDALNGKDSKHFVALLDKASNIGVLRKLGGTYYDIHPALPWFLKAEFDTHYPTPDERKRAQLAYTEAIGHWGNEYASKYIDGQRDVIHLLVREEANLLHARRFAIQYNFWVNIGTMQGLKTLYGLYGRRGEWRTLVNEIVALFCHPETDTPLPEITTNQWSIVMHYRVDMAREEREWQDAERLQLIRTTVWREETQALLNKDVDKLESNERNQIRELSVSIESLGHIQREQGEATCIDNYKEAYDLGLKIKDFSSAAVRAFNLGHAYLQIGAIHDLAESEKWYQRSLELTPENDSWGRATSLGQLGLVALERFKEARAEKDIEKATEHINMALTRYHEALSLFPANAINELAVTHNQLGLIYRDIGEATQALDHYQKSVHYKEQADDHYNAAQTRQNIAVLFANQRQFGHAMAYADAALKGFQHYGERTAQEQAKVMRLIERINAKMQGGE